MCGCQTDKGILCDYHKAQKKDDDIYNQFGDPSFSPQWTRYTRLGRFFDLVFFAHETIRNNDAKAV